MAKYAFLISPRDTAPVWIDHDLSTSGEILPIIDDYETNGVVIEPPATGKQIYTKIPAEAINTIKVYFPE